MDDFRNRVLKITREILTTESQNETGMTSWNGNQTKGFEIVFEGKKRGIPVVSGVIGQIFITQDGGFEIILNVYIIKDNLRSVLKTVSIPDSSNLETDLSNGLSSLVLNVTSHLTLNHLLMIDLIQLNILKNLSPKAVTFLSATNRSIRHNLTSQKVDISYWKKMFLKEFGSLLIGVTNSSQSFRILYRDQMMNKFNSRKRHANNERMKDELRSNLLIESHRPRQPMIIPDPDLEFRPDHFDPLNPIPNPRLPPGHPDSLRLPTRLNPNNRFQGGNADLDPFGDPLQREMFGPPRGGGRNSFNPFFRGGDFI